MRFKYRLHDTKFLLRNYLRIKEHVQDAITSLSELSKEDFTFFEGLVDKDEQIDVDAIVRSRGKSAIMLAHIDAMLRAYRKICTHSPHEEDQRRYRVLESMCLVNPTLTVDQIAEIENIDRRTIYKDFEAACERMSALIFGIQWIER